MLERPLPLTLIVIILSFLMISSAYSQDGPAISNVNISQLTHNSVTITWTTSAPAKSKIEYGKTPSYGKTTNYSTNFTTTHTKTLTGLESYTTYHYRIIAKDKYGAIATSGDFTFTTKDPYPPKGSVKINNGAAYTNSLDVVLNLSATDTGGSGLDKMQFSNDNKTWSEPIPYAEQASWRLKEGKDGTRKVYAKFIDKFGNISSAAYDEIGLDTTAPTGTIKINNDVPKTSILNVTLNLYATDACSGINRNYGAMLFSNDGISYTQPEPYNTIKNWQLSEGPDGTRTVYVRFTDRAGNISSPIKDDIILDTRGPEISGISVSNITHNSATINWTTDIPATGQIEYGETTSYGNSSAYFKDLVKTHKITITFLKSYTTYHYRIISKDTYGTAAKSGDFTFTTKDPYPPKGSVKINNGAAYTNSLDVVLNLSATDTGGSGLDKMQFSNDNKTWSEPIPYTEQAGWRLKEGKDGSRKVYAKFIDKSGNISSAVYDEIALDTTAPTGTIKINNNAATTKTRDVTLSLSAKDSFSGINTTYGKMCFSNDNLTYSNPEPYKTTRAWQLTAGKGIKTVYAKYQDRAGNWSEPVSDAIEYIPADNIPPSGTITINQNSQYTNSRDVTLTPSAQDNPGGSGMDTMSFSNDGKNYSIPQPYSASPVSWTLPEGDGEKTVYAVYTDKELNRSNAVSDTIILDTTPPLITITNPTTPTNKDVVLSYIVSDNFTPSYQITVTGDNSPYTTEGDYSVVLTLTDKAGNATKTSPISFNIDKTPPAIIITSPQNNSIFNSPTITLQGTIDETPFTEQRQLTEGENTITKTATDQAGNTASASITIILDTVPPTITLTQPATPTNQNVILSYTVSDNISPPEKITVTGDNSPYTEEKDYSVALTATDEAGNSTTSTPINFTIDKTPPTIALKQPTTPTDQSVTLSYTVSDNISSPNKIIVTGDNSPYTEVGDYSVTLTATDEAGNSGNSNTVNFTIVETLPPIIIDTDTTIDVDNIDYENRDITVDGCTVTINGKHTFKHLSIVNGGVVTHAPCTTTASFDLYLTVDTLTIDPTSSIDVTGKGYLSGHTLGNATEGASTFPAGGSYGGLGGYTEGNSSNNIYGDLFNPDELGSGGSRAGSGGGLINIQANSIILNGSIKADAETGYRGNGSGGCINITTQVLSGSGTITANGGTGYRDSNISSGDGGGGGRIAIFYDDITGFNRNNIQNHGGEQTYWYQNGRHGGAGTIYLKSSTQSYGDLIINNNNLTTDIYSTPLRSVGQGTITAISYDTLTDENANFPIPNPQTGALGLIGLKLNPNLNQSQTFTIIDNTKTTITVDGDMFQVAKSGDTYIGVYTFDNLYIRNKAKVETKDIINVLATIEITDANLKAYDLNFSDVSDLDFTDAVIDTEKPLFDNLDTVNLQDQSLAINGDDFRIINNLNLDNSQIILDGTLSLTNNLTLANSSTITHPAATTTTTSRLNLTCNTLTIDSTSKIDVIGKGYLGSWKQDNNSANGMTLGNLPGSAQGSGASYGGLGAGQNPNPTYGDFKDPNELGSGGGYGAWLIPAGSGGGLIKINASQINLDGQIIADGEDLPYGGSGGGINIHTQTLSGNGIISANGGDWEGGGGRIAVYYDDISGFNKDNIQNHGAAAEPWGYDNGGAGTIYLKSSTQGYGDLIINNNGFTTDIYSTPLRSIGQGRITAISATTLTDENANFPIPNPQTGALGLIGLKLNPNLNQSQTFTIIDNTQTTITVDGNMFQVASAGDTYIGVYTFDNLYIRNKAKVETKDIINVLSTIEITDSSLKAYDLNFNDVSDLNLTDAVIDTDEPLFEGRDTVTLQNQSLTINGDDLGRVGTLNLLNNTTITHSAATTASTSRLDITCNTLTIDPTSKIDVSGKGCLPGHTLGNTTEGASTPPAGASYGGLGGYTEGNSSNNIYGDLFNPDELGSGGSRAGSGGGLIKIQANSITLDGSIKADAETGGRGNGSGGCINITTQVLSGAGTITANGGTGYRDDVIRCGDGGGGGRIAIFYDDIANFNRNNIQNHGGEQTYWYQNGRHGGAGTIYLKSSTQSYGDLIVANSNLTSDIYSTPLRSVGQGTITAISYNTLTDENADFPIPDPETGALGLIGLKLNPNLNQSQTFTIIDNTKTTTTVNGDMFQVAHPGDTYIGVYTFDNVTVINGAKVSCKDYINILGTLITTGGELAIDPEMPIAKITSPQQGETLSGTVTIIGTATDKYLSSATLDYGKDADPSSWVVINALRSSVTNGILGTWNTTLVANGDYILRLQVKDAVNNITTINIQVTVYNEGPDIQNLSVIPNPFSPDESGTYVDLTTGEVFNDPGPNRVLDDIAVISFNMATHAYMKIYIYNSGNELIRKLVDRVVYPGAGNKVEIEWNGRDQNGAFVKNGDYTIVVNAGSPQKEQSIVVTVNKMPTISNFSVKPDPFSPDGDGVDETTTISYSISEDSYVSVKIYDSLENLVRTVLNQEFLTRGSYNHVWDGRDDLNKLLLEGRYKIIIEARTEAGNEATPVIMYVSMTSISDIGVYNKEFDPHQGQTCEISYYLGSDAVIGINIYNEDNVLVRALITEQPRSAGRQAEAWDGKDGSGQIVPDGLYYFIIEDSISGSSVVIYDPRGTGGESISHGVSFSATAFDSLKNIPSILTYNLPQPARVTIKVRKDRYSGLVLKVIKYLEPNIAGEHQTIWDGRDEAGNLLEPYNYTLAIWAYTLMDGAIIVTGGRPIVSDVVAAPVSFCPMDNPYSSLPEVTTISYLLSKDSNVTIRIFDSNNTLVRTINEGIKTAGGNQAIWDGKNDYLQPVPDDRDRVEIQADIDGNYSDTRTAHVEIYY